MLTRRFRFCLRIWVLWPFFVGPLGEENPLGNGINLFQGYIYAKVTLTPNIDSLQPREIIPTMKLTLYGNYLIEPITQTNSSRRVTVGADTSVIHDLYISYDTIGYCFIDLKKRTYLMFDTLRKDSKIVERGSLSDKKFGLSFDYQLMEAFENDASLTIKDTVEQGHPCKLATAVSDSNTPMLIKARIRTHPHRFPFQISPYLSRKTAGGFTDRVEFIGLGKQRSVLIYQVSYQEAALPEAVIQLINAWAERSDSL